MGPKRRRSTVEKKGLNRTVAAHGRWRKYFSIIPRRALITQKENFAFMQGAGELERRERVSITESTAFVTRRSDCALFLPNRSLSASEEEADLFLPRRDEREAGIQKSFLLRSLSLTKISAAAWIMFEERARARTVETRQAGR